MPFDDDKIEVITPERVELNFPISSLGSRFVAALVDIIIIILINIIITFIFIPVSGSLSSDNDYLYSLIIGFELLLRFVLSFGYYIYFEYIWNGQTPGKRILNIRVMRYSGLPMNFSSSAIRNLMRIVDFVLFASAIGFLILFLSKLSQRPGDFAAGTIVVHDRNITLDDLDLYLKSSQNESKNNAPLDGRFDKLSDEDARLIEMFINRRSQMDVSQRREMAEKIANGIRGKLNLKLDEYGGNEILIRTANKAIKQKRDKW